MSMQILTHEALHRRAPAIFAEAPHEAVTSHYGFVPTIDVVEGLEQEGWFAVHARQTRSRDPERQGVTRHLIRFRQDCVRQLRVGDSVAELVLTNSHDRTSSFQLNLGLFRLVCSNGMVAPAGEIGSLRVRHGRHIVETLLEHSVKLVSQIPSVAEQVESFQSTPMGEWPAQRFAEQALALRYGPDWSQASPVLPQALIEPRRREDVDGTLWNTFSRIQENLLKGGLRGRSRTGRRTRTRAIRSVGEDVRLNRGLWKLTEHWAEQLAA